MSELRLNPLNGRWVTIAATHAVRPRDFSHRDAAAEADLVQPCPFCPGHEEATPAALETVDGDGGWLMRVVPNRYPAFDGTNGLVVRNLGPVHVMARASGIHEVFVYTPDHDGGLHQLDDDHAEKFMLALRRRVAEHAGSEHVRYTQAIVNHGRTAGASLSHPHGQLLGLPFVPGEILDEERAFARFAGGCILCATVESELVDGARVVFEDQHVVVVCPWWSGTPFEMLVIPRAHDLHLQDADDDTVGAVGRAMRSVLGQLRAAMGDLSYNVVFHTAAHHHAGSFHWHVHVWPKLATTAGFERGTGVLVNIVAPETAAEELRQVVIPV